MSEFERTGDILLRSLSKGERRKRNSEPSHQPLLPGNAYPLPIDQPDMPGNSSGETGILQPRRGLYLVSSCSAIHTGKVDSQTAAVSSPVCSICKGARWLRQDLPPEHPAFGKLVACSCLLQQRHQRRSQGMLKLCTLFGFQRDKTLESFRPQVKGVQQAVRESKRLVGQLREWSSNQRQDAQQMEPQAMPEFPDEWIVFVGSVGVGKTHLAMAIGNACVDAGMVVLFATVPDLLDHLRAAFAPASEEPYDDVFERMRNAELLILDDLGAERSSSWAHEKLFQLLNYRYTLRWPTVVTMNRKAWMYLDDRLQSRLSDRSLVCLVNMEDARDYRGHQGHNVRHLASLPPDTEGK